MTAILVANIGGSTRQRKPIAVACAALAAGKSILVLELRNGGTSRAAACLGPGRSISQGTGTSFEGVDHPGCERAFDVPPGGVLTWREPAGLTDDDRVPVAVAVQILNPRRCSGGSCAAFMLASRAGDPR